MAVLPLRSAVAGWGVGSAAAMFLKKLCILAVVAILRMYVKSVRMIARVWIVDGM